MSTRLLQLPLLALLLGLACGPQARAAEPSSAIEAQSRALQRASASVVGLRALAVDDARSAATLGRARQGSGVVIGSGDLVLTIGYLVLEAERVQLVTDDEREVPARLVGYDVATGFGLVQALAPLRIEPVPFGTTMALARGEPLMIVSGGEDGAISAAQLVSRRSFSGYWEYHVDGALFTSPARSDHSGAGLFNSRGELVGIGSLLVKDAAGADGPAQNGNMFVPIDLLRPILPELSSRGSSHLSQRAWMGVNCVEAEGTVRVVRVNSDSPAEVAGLEPGDRIVRIDGTEVKALEVLWKTLWAGGAPEREVTLDIVRGGKPQTLKLQSVDRMKTLKRAQGI
jgi:S1-C subfamily serine protease